MPLDHDSKKFGKELDNPYKIVNFSGSKIKVYLISSPAVSFVILSFGSLEIAFKIAWLAFNVNWLSLQRLEVIAEMVFFASVLEIRFLDWSFDLVVMLSDNLHKIVALGKKVYGYASGNWVSVRTRFYQVISTFYNCKIFITDQL